MKFKFIALKFKRIHHRSFKNKETVQFKSLPSTGSFFLTSYSKKFLNFRQVDAGFRVVLKKIKKQGNAVFFLSSDRPLCKKKKGMRMGGGVGAVYSWISKIRMGSRIYETCFLTTNVQRIAKISKEVISKLSICGKIRKLF